MDPYLKTNASSIGWYESDAGISASLGLHLNVLLFFLLSLWAPECAGVCM